MMNQRFHHSVGPFDGHRAFDEREDGFRTLPERFDGGPRGGDIHTLPNEPGDGEFRTLPGRPGFPGGMPPFGRPVGPGLPGGPVGPRMPGMPGGHNMPGGRRVPFGPGRPPVGPTPEFLKERIGEADLAELLGLAGRMARHRPEGDPAQGQNLVLSILAGREALPQRALQQMLGVQPGSLSEILTKLERKGFLTREKAEDRRGNLLRITDAGRAALPGEEASGEDDRFSALTDEQQDQLAALLRALLNDWADRFAPQPRCPGRFGGDPRAERPAPPDLGTKV